MKNITTYILIATLIVLGACSSDNNDDDSSYRYVKTIHIDGLLYQENIYDDEDNMIRRNYYNNNDIAYYYTYDYDDSKLVKRNFFWDYGKKSTIKLKEFDEAHGRLNMSKSVNSVNFTLSSFHDYSYYGYVHCILDEYYYNDESSYTLDSYTEYNYDFLRNRVKSETVYDADGDMMYYAEYLWNEDGQHYRKNWYYSSYGEPVHYRSYFYEFDDKKRPDSQYLFEIRGKLRDHNTTKYRREDYDVYGNTEYWYEYNTTFEYDSKGYPTKEIDNYSNISGESSQTTYIYTYTDE